MSYDWREFLTLAGALQDQAGTLCSDVACYRSAASRAYYAAFNTAIGDLAKPTGFRPEYNGFDHKRFRTHLVEVSKRTDALLPGTLQGISSKLNRLFRFRREADYDKKLKHEPKHLASLAVGEAEYILADVDEYLEALKKQQGTHGA